MKLTAIIRARAVALFDIDELNRNGVVRLADIVSSVVKRYGFLTFPSTPEEFNLEKGVKFGSGKQGDIVIDVMTIWPGMITVETLRSTADSQAILKEMLEWGRSELGFTYQEEMLRRWGYISQITFTCDFPLLSAISAPLSNLARKTGEAVNGLFEEGLPYEVAKVNVGHDPLMRKNGIAGVTIEHRANFRFGDNKFFSEAPLPTELHIKFLEEFEAEILNSHVIV